LNRFVVAFLGLAVGVCVAAQAQAPAAPTYSLDEITVLDGIGGFGTVGKIEPSRTLVAPGGALGFSLKITWDAGPTGEGYWSIRQPLPPGDRAQFDTLAFDLYVESEDKANLAIFLAESDDDRWLCLSGPLKQQEPGKWRHFEVHRDKMSPWQCGDKKQDWSKLAQLGIEPSTGKAVFCLDGVRLLGPGGKKLEVFDAGDDGVVADPKWREPVHRLDRSGVIVFPGISRESLGDTPAKLAQLVGRVATSVYGPDFVRRVVAQGVQPVYYSAYAEGFTKFLTRRQAWDMNARGESPNTLPFFIKAFNGYHTIAYGHPAVTEVGRRRVDALVRSGIGTWMVIDYTFPWAEGPNGYSEANVKAYRLDLAGRDEGLVLVDGRKARGIRFADYFRAYNGFLLTPGQLGLKCWEDFAPSKPDDTGPYSRARWRVFLYLRSYEWLKLADRTGRYYQSRGGEGVWIVPNPEDTWGSSDYMMLTRSLGVRNLMPEWFGCPGWEAEGMYASGPYLRGEADRAGSRLSVLFETGAGGHAAPYWDWRVAYNAAYALSAASRADDFDNDFIDEAPYDVMSDPAKDQAQFRRFRDGVTKALGFLQARAEKPRRPATEILCISERPPAKACGSIFFGVTIPHTLAVGLSRAHFAFDLRDSFELERVINGYRVLAYSPWAPRSGDLSLIARWLTLKPGRVLMTHSFVPTRDTSEFWGGETGTERGYALGGPLLGLGRITGTDVKRCKVTAAFGAWGQVFTPGQVLEFPTPLTRCDLGETLVATDAGPLVSRVAAGKSEIIYLHYTPGDTEPVQRIDEKVMEAVGASLGLQPVCRADFDTVAQVFEVPGGSTVVAWDAPTMAAWKFEYKPGIAPLLFEAANVDRAISVPAGEGNWLVYDFWADKLEPVTPAEGRANLSLRGAVTGLWYVGPDNEKMRATIGAAQKLRARMRDLGFEKVGM
jgi:hypothetical protein